MKNKPIIINLFAGSGAGKSTGAAYIFSQLKMKGVNCELVTEYAKDKTWEKTEKIFENQAYIFGKQYYRLSRLHGEVDLIITDSPLLLSIVYNSSNVLGNNFNNMVLDVFNSYYNINYYINRTKKYNPKGRWQTTEEAKELDVRVKNTLVNSNISFNEISGDVEGYDLAVKDIIKWLKNVNV